MDLLKRKPGINFQESIEQRREQLNVWPPPPLRKDGVADTEFHNDYIINKPNLLGTIPTKQITHSCHF
jgi:hypothetical protein